MSGSTADFFFGGGGQRAWLLSVRCGAVADVPVHYLAAVHICAVEKPQWREEPPASLTSSRLMPDTLAKAVKLHIEEGSLTIPRTGIYRVTWECSKIAQALLADQAARSPIPLPLPTHSPILIPLSTRSAPVAAAAVQNWSAVLTPRRDTCQ